LVEALTGLAGAAALKAYSLSHSLGITHLGSQSLKGKVTSFLL
jgi:hypothetical protein